MVSVDGLLDAHEVMVRARVDELREQLAGAERELEHVAITRNTLRAVVAAGGVVLAADGGEVAVKGPVSESEPTVVPVRAEGMTEQVLPLSYRQLWLVARDAGEPVRAGQMARALGLPSTPAKVEGTRSKLKRLAERGWVRRSGSGAFQVV